MNMRKIALLTTCLALSLLGCKEHETQVVYWNGDTDKPKEVFQIDKETGKKDGPYKAYYRNGNLDVETTYKDGLRDGGYKSYYDDGDLNEETTYKEGQRDGVRKQYYHDGKLKCEEFYKNDTLQGTRKCFYENGNVRLDETYKSGLMDGVRKFFDKTGDLQEETTLKEGRLVWQKRNDGGIRVECEIMGELSEKPHDLIVFNDLLNCKNIIRINRLNGVSKDFSRKSGKLHTVCTYNDGNATCDNSGLLREWEFIKNNY